MNGQSWILARLGQDLVEGLENSFGGDVRCLRLWVLEERGIVFEEELIGGGFGVSGVAFENCLPRSCNDAVDDGLVGGKGAGWLAIISFAISLDELKRVGRRSSDGLGHVLKAFGGRCVDGFRFLSGEVAEFLVP